MISLVKTYIYEMKKFLDGVNYKFIYKSMAEDDYRNNPFLKKEYSWKDSISEKQELLIRGFYFNYPIEVNKFGRYFDYAILESLEKLNFITVRKNTIFFMGYSVIVIEDTYIVVQNRDELLFPKTDKVYIGPDTFEIIKYIDRQKGLKVLDLCSGTGVLGLVMCSYASHVVAVELDLVAYQLCKFNVILNSYEDIMEVRRGDLYDVVEIDECFDYIITNPPYVAVPKELSFPLCADGGENGSKIVDKIINYCNKFLSENGKLLMILEGLGNEENPFFKDYLENIRGEKYLSIISRRNSKFQSEIYGRVSYKRRSEHTEKEYTKIWQEYYRANNVTFIYYMLFVLINNKKNTLDILRYFNPFSLDSLIKINENVILKRYGEQYIILIPEQKTLFINARLYELLKNNKVVSLRTISEFSGEEIELIYFQLKALEEAGFIERIN